jgi:hypothetical protein
MGLTLCSQLSVPTLSPPIAFESPNPIAASTGLCKVLRATVTLNEVSSVGGLIARRYLDGSEVPSFRFLNFTAESTSKLRRLRSSGLSPRVQTEKGKGRFGWRGYGREDIRRAKAQAGGWECIRRTAATKPESASTVCARCSRHCNRNRLLSHRTILNRARSGPNRTI